MELLITFLNNLIKKHLSSEIGDFFLFIALIFFLSLSLMIIFFLTKKVFISLIGFLVRKSKNSIDNIFWNKKFYHLIPHLSVATFLLIFSQNLASLDKFSQTFLFIHKIGIIYLSVITLLLIDRLLRNLLTFYETLNLPDNFNIKAIYQATKIFLYLLAAIIIIATFIGESPWKILSGIGALTAVLLFIFKEPLLGFVAGIQLFANKMVKVGDWIEMPQQNVDGNIIDISLTTIKLKNWDNTIVQIPSHTLTTQSFKNWEGMKKSGGRRIKRSLFIDMKTIRFITSTELKQLEKIPVFKDYFEKRNKELGNFEIDQSKKLIQNTRTKNTLFPTTLGVFREYTHHYLKNHPQLHDDFTLLVRGLNPVPQGLPLEIYVFTKTTDWIKYENIQSEIFEHLISVAKNFYLKIFQEPTGSDFYNLRK